MTKTYLFTKAGLEEDVPLDDWRSLVEGECKLLWVDVREATSDEIHKLSDQFGLHRIAVESCHDEYRRPHLYEFPDHLYVNLTVLRPGDDQDHDPKPSELHLFAGSTWVITLTSEKNSEAVDKALDEYRDTPQACERGSIYAVYLLTEDLVETYYPLVEQLDDAADELETQMLKNSDKDSLQRLFALKRQGFEIRRLLGPQRDVITELSRRDFPFMEGEDRIYFQDVYNRMIRIFDVMDTIREVLSGSLDIYLSTVSNRLNEVMKVLTVAATILMMLSFITGFFGMNFIHLPWLHAPNAFRNIIIFMVIVTLGMTWWFRRKNWM